MNRRIEFSLNMENAQEAEIYRILSRATKHRRAGELIRQALVAYLFSDRPGARQNASSLRKAAMTAQGLEGAALGEELTDSIVSQSAEMFGF